MFTLLLSLRGMFLELDKNSLIMHVIPVGKISSPISPHPCYKCSLSAITEVIRVCFHFRKSGCHILVSVTYSMDCSQV